MILAGLQCLGAGLGEAVAPDVDGATVGPRAHVGDVGMLGGLAREPAAAPRPPWLLRHHAAAPLSGGTVMALIVTPSVSAIRFTAAGDAPRRPASTLLKWLRWTWAWRANELTV